MRFKIHTSLLIWLVLVTLPIALAGVFAIQVIDARLSDRITADLANAQRLEAARIEESLRLYQKDARSIASELHVTDFVEKVGRYRSGLLPPGAMIGGYGGFALVDPEAEFPLQELALGLQENAKSVGSEVVELRLLDHAGQTLGTTDNFSWEPYDGKLLGRAMASSETLFGNAFQSAAGEGRLGLVEPIRNNVGQVVGALVLEMRLGTVVDLAVHHEEYGETSESYIVQPTPNGSAELITPMRFRRDAAFNLIVPKRKNQPTVWSLNTPVARVVRAPDYRNEDSILAIKTIAATGWGLVVKIDATETFAPVNEMRRVIAVACLVAVVVVLLGWALYLNPLAKRIQMVARAASKMSNGDYNTLIADKAGDEIGDMARSIDKLTTDLRHDIELRAEVESQLRHQATHDELTGLHNRMFVNQYIQTLNKNNQNATATVFFLDLNGFKTINDNLGHTIGDEILICVATRLKKRITDTGMLARWGGDEFIIICPNLEKSGIAEIAEKLRSAFKLPMATSAGNQQLGCSIGISTSNAETSINDVLHHADKQMYIDKQKRRGGGTPEIVSESAALIHRALKQDSLEVWYQPLISTESNGDYVIDGVEALVRLRADDGSIVPPLDFLPHIHELPESALLDQFVLNKSLTDLAQWKKSNLVPELFVVSVNLCGPAARDPQFTATLTTQLERLELDASCLMLELSERTTNYDHVVIKQLEKMGIAIALDDIGIGFSNLDRIFAVTPAVAKLDGLWLSDLLADAQPTHLNNYSHIVLPRLTEICTELGISIIAEGVENKEQLQILQSLGVTRFQGYLFDAPLMAVDLVACLSSLKPGNWNLPKDLYKKAS